MRHLLVFRFRTRRSIRWIAPILTALTFIALIPTADATLPPDAVEFVIVTNAELAPAFESLATFKTGIGIPSRL